MTDSTNTSSFLGSRLREGAFIGVAAVCLYLLMALLTYSASDPGWSATGNGAGISNLGGPTGAWLADVFFSLVGYAAYLFPLMLAYRAIILLGSEPTKTFLTGPHLEFGFSGWYW